LRVDGKARATRATTEPRELFGVQVLFFFVRATETLGGLRPFATHLSPAMMIVAMQNGLGNEDAIKTALGSMISLVVAATTESTLIVGPGEVQRVGKGTTVLGSAGASPETCNRIARLRFPCQRGVRHPAAIVGQADRERRDQPRRRVARPSERCLPERRARW
jgi:ketopantoate reductase